MTDRLRCAEQLRPRTALARWRASARGLAGGASRTLFNGTLLIAFTTGIRMAHSNSVYAPAEPAAVEHPFSITAAGWRPF